VAFLVPEGVPAAVAAAAVAEGAVLGRYSLGRYRSNDNGAAVVPVERLSLLSGDAAPVDLEAMASRALIVGGAANLARELCDTPARELTPSAFADRVLEETAGLEAVRCEIVEGDGLREEQLTGLLAVGAASSNPPRLVHIRYEGAPGDPEHVALVGKGITFDSGGLDLKPNDWMQLMKADMGGAAAVLAAIVAAARLELPLNVVGLLALAENMPGAGALRPSDVLRHRGGRTSEVVSPDAEGRLVLADALVMAGEQRPDAIVEVSTLTGGTALGADLWGVIARDTALADDLVAAGARAREPGWALPLWRRYLPYLDSRIADVANMGTPVPFASPAITGALFLDGFVPDGISWAHVDVGATVTHTVRTESAWPAGATGSPTRALVSWLAARAGVDTE
jgi:leucyl aminopeptidase